MSLLPLVPLLALLETAAPRGDAALWDAAFQLGDPPRASQARKTLVDAGAAGQTVLLRMARSGGDAPAIQALLAGQPCALIPSLLGSREPPSPATHAARELGQRVLTEPALRERLRASPDAFERRFVLTALVADPALLLTQLPPLEHERDARVLTSARESLECAGRARLAPGAKRPDPGALRDARRQLTLWLDARVPTSRCATAEDLQGALQEGLAAGTWRASGWSASDGELRVSLSSTQGERTTLSDQCALGMYDALARRGEYRPALVMPLATSEELEPGLREQAGQRAVADLEHYPEAERNGLAAQLVNAGFPVAVRVTFDTKERAFLQPEHLEAALRQQQPEARAAVERTVFCHGTFGDSGIALLGYLGTPEAAALAWRYATQCPSARQQAAAALVRLEDPRALEPLEAVLQEPLLLDNALMRALREHATPAVLDRLGALARDGSDNARRLLGRLGKPLPETP